MQKNITTHVSVERFDRIEYIIDTIGLGDSIIMEANIKNPQNIMRKMQLTNTGVILVKPVDREVVITAWIASLNQVVQIYRTRGYAKMPEYVYRLVKKNQKYMKNQP